MKRKLFYAFLAFLLSIIAFCLFLAFYGVLGNGNYTILRGDLVAQYIDFISMYIRVLKGEEDFWYSFSLYYGSGTILTFAYYVFSPFNLLYLIDSVSIATMTAIVITLKIALCGFTFALFAQTVLKCKARYAVFFSLCYAMNGFVITLHFNLIWLEAAYMLPLIILLLFRLADNGKWLALVPAWAFLFLTNFYMAYIVGIFSAFVFIGLLILRLPSFSGSSLKQCIKPTIRFSLSVVLATGISAVLLIPTAVFLMSHMAADNFGFDPLPTTILEVAGSLFMGEMPDLDNRAPYMYCGLPVLLLFPFYFVSAKFRLKERLIIASVLVFYVLSMLILPLFIFMHAFDYPNWYFFRFSFCICFLLCAI
ncbi:MAG: YfhO family protein, partial [Lachnospiraceae bacterium]|nr:YfhO family protein [Lachnospiraceae bacterium]